MQRIIALKTLHLKWSCIYKHNCTLDYIYVALSCCMIVYTPFFKDRFVCPYMVGQDYSSY